MAYTIVKTPIVYYGGKTSIIHHMLERVPVHEVYTETFFGGGTLFWAKDPVKNETINDRLDIVINFYRVLRGSFRPLKKMIDATLISRKIHNEALTIIRKHKKGWVRVDKVRLAWAFWLCTNFAYSNKIGGGYKYSNDMSVAVPDTLAKRKAAFTDALASRIEHAYIENDDALKILQSRNVVKAFHELDPPYPGVDQGHYSGYTWDDFQSLLNWCAFECKGKFMLHNYNSEMLERFVIENDWYKKEITHMITGSKAHNPRINRRDRTEVIVTNYSTPCGTLKLF